jgi:hypothetical protein
MLPKVNDQRVQRLKAHAALRARPEDAVEGAEVRVRKTSRSCYEN